MLEKQTERLILDYANVRGFAVKMEGGGRPVMGEMGETRLIPFRNKYSVNGIPDIFAAINGKAYWVELKSPAAILPIYNCFKEGMSCVNRFAKNPTISRQIEFLLKTSRHGITSAFISSLGGFIKLIGDIDTDGPYIHSPSKNFYIEGR